MRRELSKREKEIERIVCPETKLPAFFNRRKRERGDMGWAREVAAPEEGKASRRRKEDEDDKYKAEFLKAMKSIKDIHATTFVGMSKKKYKEEQLISLGAPRVKEQTMPFKMKMGILAGWKKREQRELRVAKESGQVLPVQKRNRDYRKTGKANGPGIDVSTRKGVLHVSKNASIRGPSTNRR